MQVPGDVDVEVGPDVDPPTSLEVAAGELLDELSEPDGAGADPRGDVDGFGARPRAPRPLPARRPADEAARLEAAQEMRDIRAQRRSWG